MNISIFGLGYVGAVSLACLARDGHRVVGVDVDQAKVDLIRAGKTPVVEEGMVQLMADVTASGRVTVTRDANEAIRETELSLNVWRLGIRLLPQVRVQRLLFAVFPGLRSPYS